MAEYCDCTVDGNFIMMQGGSFVSELRPATTHLDQDAVTFDSLCSLQTVEHSCSLPRDNIMEDAFTGLSCPVPTTSPAGPLSVAVG